MTHTIGFLGFGSMAQAICRGALASKIVQPTSIFFTQRNSEAGHATASELGITFCSTEQLVSSVDILVLGIKPQQLNDALHAVQPLGPELTVVSLLAGTPISRLSEFCSPETGIVRTMPNTPALINKGLTAVCTNSHVNSAHRETVNALFESVGSVQVVDESEMDIVTALSGSGPAFIYALARDMVQEGVAQGLSETAAQTLVYNTIIGAGEMLRSQSSSPDTLIANVASPGGTTEAGLDAYEKEAIASRIQAVINAAANRSAELRQGKES